MKNVYSPYKITQHPEHIKALKSGWTIPPIHLNIDTTMKCTQNCEFCYRNNLQLGGVTRRKNNLTELSAERLKTLVDEIVAAGIKGVELTGQYGEPTFNPAFDDFVIELVNHGIPVGLITNGDLLDKKLSTYLLSYIRVSMSSLKDELHKKVRGGHRPVQEILNNLKEINKQKNRTITGIGLTIDEYNYSEVYDFCKVVTEIGSDNIRLTQVWKDDPSYWNDIRSSVFEQVKRAREDFKNITIIGPEEYEKVYLGEKKYSKCYYSHLVMNITADGECYPCCVTRGVKGWSFGNIHDKSLDEIIWGYDRRKLLKNIQVTKCPKCIWDSKNEFLEYVVEGGEHAEFI
jgi:radical SAM protein with 4Fe4S-binding SPASM domain